MLVLIGPCSLWVCVCVRVCTLWRADVVRGALCGARGITLAKDSAVSSLVIDGKTGYEVEYGKACEGVAVPWGCAATYLADEVDKVDPRGRAGVMMGYAQDLRPHHA